MSKKREIEIFDNEFNRVFIDGLDEINEGSSKLKSDPSQIYSYYNELVNIWAELIQEIVGEKASIANYFGVYRFLLSNGLLSENQKFYYGYDPEEIIYQEGMSIISGVGNDRNISALFADILKCIYKNKMILLAATNINDSNNFYPRSELPILFAGRNDYDPRKNIDPISNPKNLFLPNHREVLIRSNNSPDSMFLLDPTGMRVQILKLEKQEEERRCVDLRFSLLDSMLVDDNKRKEFLFYAKNLMKYLEKATRFDLSKESIDKLMTETVDVLNGKNKTISEFNNSRYISDVKKYVSLSKKRIYTDYL